VNDAPDLGELWEYAATVLPAGWRLDALQCASIGLEPSQRSDDWTAVALDPDDRPVRVTASTPRAAIDRMAAEIDG
jgi:hypothetical protein